MKKIFRSRNSAIPRTKDSASFNFFLLGREQKKKNSDWLKKKKEKKSYEKAKQNYLFVDKKKHEITKIGLKNLSF